MAAAPNLPVAAGQAFDNLFTKWTTNTLKSSLTAFWQNTIDSFPQEIEANHPVSNWLILIAALAEEMPGSFVPLALLTPAAQYVYRICWMTNYLEQSGQITAAQATTGPNSILVQYNAQF